jgi:tetraacyldisaccharide 4'-kinase
MGRDFDLVLLSAEDPFGRGAYLPRGYLRDSPKRLSQANAIFLNPIESEADLEPWKTRLGESAPLIGVRGTTRAVGGKIVGASIGLFCGIARPARFKKSVAEFGASVVQELILADHEGISEKELQSFSDLCKSLGAKYLVCTEKDFIKLPPDLRLSLPLVYLELEMKITAGIENWQNLVAKIDRKIDNCGTYDR